jgi:regulator of replication initiation timing
MKTLWKIVIIAMFAGLITCAVLTYFNYPPIAVPTKAILHNILTFNWAAIPGQIWTLLTGLGASIAMIGKWVSGKINHYKKQFTTTQSKYNDLQSDAAKVCTENQKLSSTLTEQQSSLQKLTAEKDQALMQTQQTKDQLEAAKQQINKAQAQVQALTEISARAKVLQDGGAVIKTIVK